MLTTLKEIAVFVRYLVIHKWHVFRACAKYGLWWRGLVHDLSKLTPRELLPYARHFSRSMPTSAPAFAFAWSLHQKRNDHHWQWWVCVTSRGNHVAMPMSPAARIEMICDWCGAGIAQGDPDIRGWYERNKEGMLLHPETRVWVERNL